MSVVREFAFDRRIAPSDKIYLRAGRVYVHGIDGKMYARELQPALPTVTSRLRAANDKLEASLAHRRAPSLPPPAVPFRNATRLARTVKT